MLRPEAGETHGVEKQYLELLRTGLGEVEGVSVLQDLLPSALNGGGQ